MTFPFCLKINIYISLLQSTVILKYLARQYGLIATNTEAQASEEMLEGVITDVRHHFIVSIYFQSFSTEVELEQKLRSYLSNVLADFEKWIGKKKWLLSQQKPSYVDFMAYEAFDWYRTFLRHTDIFAAFPRMSAHMSRFEALPRVQSYLLSDTHLDAYCISPFVAKAQIRHRLKKSFEVKEE